MVCANCKKYEELDTITYNILLVNHNNYGQELHKDDRFSICRLCWYKIREMPRKELLERLVEMST
jgi:hypothetical protein